MMEQQINVSLVVQILIIKMKYCKHVFLIVQLNFIMMTVVQDVFV